MLYQVFVVGFFLSVALMQPRLVIADNVSVQQPNQSSVTVNNVIIRNGVVSGEIVNHSNQEVRDVELYIRHVWQWKNEFQPGNDDPGMASYYRVDKRILPGETVPFTLREGSTRETSALPARLDGQFETVVSVAGFTEIVR